MNPLTYKNQPGNIGAWRLGEACKNAKPGGDLIDRGLSLLCELQKRGFGIVALDKANPEGIHHGELSTTPAQVDEGVVPARGELDVIRQAIEERDAAMQACDDLAQRMVYKGNSVGWWHSKATTYRAALDECWKALGELGIRADGKTHVADVIRTLTAPTNPPAQAAQVDASNLPPCSECGAKSAAEAETMCICSGDKDDCHGTSIWPDDAPTAEPAAQPDPGWPPPFEVVQSWALANGYSGATDEEACRAYREAHPAEPAAQGEAVGEVFGPKAVSTMVALFKPLPPGTLLYAAQPRAVPDVAAMVNRFLGWRLPDDFCPDGGISFTHVTDPAWTHDSWPIGTNLFTAAQAEQMFRYVLAASASQAPIYYCTHCKLPSHTDTDHADCEDAAASRAMLAATSSPGESNTADQEADR